MKLAPLHTLPIAAIIFIVYACANPGNPDGGPYDETPPKFVRSTPEPGARNNKKKKIAIEFDEFIKLENAAEKVIISPPQAEMPEVKANGKKVQIEFLDTLKSNTTYTIDFGDAIVDNNEGNPMGNFSYSFSTGESIDSMEVSGVVLNAQDLEPIKGIQVGLHKNINDTAFTKLPFDRISRTDSRGQFIIKGIAPGSYRIYALKDGNQNYIFDSKTEVIAYSDSIIIPSMKPAIKQDTTWNEVDTLKIDTIRSINYTRFIPDNIILRAFKETNNIQYLTKSEREQTNKFSLYFSSKADTLPTIKGLDFDEKDAFIVESNTTNDTIKYWIKDSLMSERDTLTLQLDYLYTDTLGHLVPKRDTLSLMNKISRDKRLAMAKEAMEKKEKERKKRRRKGDTTNIVETKFFNMRIDAPSTMDINRNITINFDEPVYSIDTSAIHIEHKIDTIWKPGRFILMKDSVIPRQYYILSDWKPGHEYKLTIDSTAIKSIYGLHTNKAESLIKVKTLEEYGTLYLNIKGVKGNSYVQLLNSNDGIVREQKVKENGTCDFYFLQPNTKYYIRMFVDSNNNGKWDTGNYAEKIQPEEVFYLPKVWEMKANFEFEENWNVKEFSLDKQKLDEIKKQKPEVAKEIKNRNKERAKKLGLKK